MQDDYNITNQPIVCELCKASFRVDMVPESDYEQLQNRHHFESLVDELKMLLRVQSLYKRHPEVEGIVEVNNRKRVFERFEPSYDDSLLSQVAENDKEVLEYLRHTSFSLIPRLNFVREQLEKWEQDVRPVACPVCQQGQLKIDVSSWVDPNCIYD